ncbi:hypothetical protein BZG01_16455 [Labilibaculum manganireducens]|uniref:IraD/Gp25-like domain-containing protein n=1 Tax=Labilibaculum manganireducens TaxID=1940525 RepID=A0A2N3HY45_9BACT|nr:hypothetical protein BZG01_16455 [Labilibaculum manganireducens]
MIYYSLPLKLGRLCEKKDHEHCSLKESISQHLYLIITTALGDCLYDETFGCSIWDSDFNNKINDSRLKEEIKSGLCLSIKNHENRLDNLEIEISFSQALIGVGENVTCMKKKLDLKVNGRLAQTDEPFAFSGYFFMGPLSYY